MFFIWCKASISSFDEEFFRKLNQNLMLIKLL